MNLSDFEPREEPTEEYDQGPLFHTRLFPTDVQERAWILTQGLKDYVGMRRKYGKCILGLTFLWIVAVIAVVFLHACQTINFFLSDSVLMMLLGTTTANVISLLVIVANYLFPKNARDLLDFSESKKEPKEAS